MPIDPCPYEELAAENAELRDIVGELRAVAAGLRAEAADPQIDPFRGAGGIRDAEHRCCPWQDRPLRVREHVTETLRAAHQVPPLTDTTPLSVAERSVPSSRDSANANDGTEAITMDGGDLGTPPAPPADLAGESCIVVDHPDNGGIHSGPDGTTYVVLPQLSHPKEDATDDPTVSA